MKYFTFLVLVASLFYFGCSSKTVGTTTPPTTPPTPTTTNQTTTPPTKPTTNQTTTPGTKPTKNQTTTPGSNPTEKERRAQFKENAPGEIMFYAANDRYSAEGTFQRWNFEDFSMEKDNYESIQGTIKIDLTSIWEKSAKLTDHLKAWDYFDVEKYTTATVEIRGVHVHGESEGHATLVLEMRGYEQEVDAHFQVVNKEPLIIAGEAMVDRSIFKIGEDNTELTNEIRITFQTPLPM